MDDKPKLDLFLPGLDKELIDQRDKLQDEIDKISRKATIEEFEVIRQILHMTKDPKVINKLAKGLALVAERLPKLNELNSKVGILNFATENPEWFQIAFSNEQTIAAALERTLQVDTKDSQA